MKTTYLYKVFLVVFVCFSNLAAQDSLSVIGKYIEGHPWAMDFGITSNLTLNTFQGATISIGRFVSDHQKYRLGLSTSMRLNSGDQNGNTLNADTLSSFNNGSNDDNSYSVSLSFQYLTYATPNNRTSIFFGLGPTIGISWSKQSNNSSSTSVYNSEDIYNRSSSSNGYSAGILGSCGVEWFFSEHISIHAEYGLAFQYSKSTNDSDVYEKYVYQNTTYNNNKSHSSGSSSGWYLSGQNVLFGLSINY
jgi:hypothetical protein